MEKVEWDSYTFHLPTKLRGEPTPEERDRHFRCTITALSSVTQAPPETFIGVLNDQYDFPHALGETDASLI